MCEELECSNFRTEVHGACSQVIEELSQIQSRLEVVTEMLALAESTTEKAIFATKGLGIIMDDIWNEARTAERGLSRLVAIVEKSSAERVNSLREARYAQ